MSSTAAWVLVVLIAAYAAYAFPVMLQFRSYCRRFANAADRLRSNDPRSIDDAGTSAFERDQWWSLAAGELEGITDPQLAAEAAQLSSKIRLVMLLAVALVVACPFVARLR